jgi:hypothetical protein
MRARFATRGVDPAGIGGNREGTWRNRASEDHFHVSLPDLLRI